ncbi:MAG: tRNA 4-thiouridine(8) synthase ThiI [Thaumarchaeota archaeon]|nr:tRNA 4-thiouridine(8) synthase ThiI [Nitrososphaerota archaeon]
MLTRIVVHYGEIGTKGGNRQVFETSMRRNILAALSPIGGVRVRMVDNRFFVSLDEEGVPAAKLSLSKVFGVVWFAHVEGAPLSYPEILETSIRVLAGARKEASFRVRVRRPNKSFPMGSQEMARKLGEDIIERLGLQVNLSLPDVTLYVDIISDEALVYREHLKGPGGLPVGVSGRVLHLLSGGIDSPVAAWLMMKRGCTPVYLHFYVAPSAEPIVQSKIGELVRELSQSGEETRLILIPFSPYQLETIDLPSDYEPIVFRRFMRMVAENLASRLEFPAISTGDNLAQVASQTLQNIACIDSGSSLPTLRPLLGYDKDEIVQLARQIGTYETSILDYKDCCSIVSSHPRTRMKIADVDEAGRRHGFDELAARCISMGSMATFRDGAIQLRPLSAVLDARSERLNELGPERASG